MTQIVRKSNILLKTKKYAQSMHIYK